MLADVGRIGNVFKEDQARDRVLVNSGIEVCSKLVGRCPELAI